ncbi:MAG: hypothetical protein GY729_05040 [Desulfobacteraceae bacterium]|nr:hypothetical protein [Desulfobacteraceae bacterium]
MKKMLLSIFLLWIILAPAFAAQKDRGITVTSDLSHESEKLGTYYALIIGIQNYNDDKIPDLETPLNDAKAIEAVLKSKYGFVCQTLYDEKATKKSIYNLMRSFALKVKPEDSVLIYYAGHGDIDKTYNDGWWIPVDATAGDPITYLDNTQIQKAMRSMKARHVLLISDSCYSGTLFGQARSLPSVIDDKYYLSLYNEKSRWGMTSGNKTPVSDSGTAGHSIFAYQLIKKLKNNTQPYISTQELYTQIAPIIGNNSEQTPLCRPIKNTGDQGGEFVFVMVQTSQIKGDAISSNDTTVDKLAKERELLEKQRQELEDLKAEIEERKEIDEERQKIEAEKKRLLDEKSQTVASTNSRPSKESILEIKGPFVKFKNGVVLDKRTQLEWLVYTGHENTIGWFKAKKWALNTQYDGGGWRMPKYKEIQSLYKGLAQKINKNYIFSQSVRFVWYADTATSRINLRNGKIIPETSRTLPTLILAVRKKK